jgi:hypothetical protein
VSRLAKTLKEQTKNATLVGLMKETENGKTSEIAVKADGSAVK